MVEGYLNIEEQDKKKKKRIETMDKSLQKNKEIEARLSKSKLSLNELQELIKEGAIVVDDINLLDKIAKDEILEDHELDDILQDVELNDLLHKIEEIEKTLDMDAILPKELRIKPQDFSLACKNPAKRQEVLQKLDDGIDCIVSQIHPSFKSGGNPFARRVSQLSNLVFLAHKKIIDLQGHMIDIKNYLRSK